MAAGIPVVACNFPNISKIINECNCGLLIDPSNYLEIAKAIINLIENKEYSKQLGLNARVCFEDTYNWEIMEKGLLNIYTKVIN